MSRIDSIRLLGSGRRRNPEELDMFNVITGDYSGAVLVTELHPKVFAPLREISDSQDLQAYISKSHLYMIIARPQIKVRATKKLLRGSTLQFRSEAAEEFREVRFSCGTTHVTLDLRSEVPEQHTSAMTVTDGGRRVRVQLTESTSVFLNVHVLAAMHSFDDPPVFNEASKWRIVYIGETSELIKRIRGGHHKLQPILDDYLSRDWEVNIVAVTVARTSSTPIGSSYDGPELDPFRLIELSTHDGARETRSIALVIENALISYFQPEYNEINKKWPGKHVREFIAAGMSELKVEFNAHGDIYRLFTADRPLPGRGFTLTSLTRGTFEQASIPGTTTTLEPHAEYARLLAASSQAAIAAAHASTPTLRCFGDQVFVV
jgi:hypothetical protein